MFGVPSSILDNMSAGATPKSDDLDEVEAQPQVIGFREESGT